MYGKNRCFAACAPVFKARKNVHHIVLEALNSNDEVEVQVSQSFNSGAIGVIAAKLQVCVFDYLLL